MKTRKGLLFLLYIPLLAVAAANNSTATDVPLASPEKQQQVQSNA